MGKIIILISSKGGSGKSTLAVGLATALSGASKKVLLIDADEGARCLDTLLSVDSGTVFDIADVLNGNAELEQVICSVPKLPNVSVAPSPYKPEPLDFIKLSDLAQRAAEEYDYVIIDTKGQLSAKRLSELPKESLFITVVTPDNIAIKNTGILTSELDDFDIKCRLIINRYETHSPDKKINNIDFMIDACRAQLIGIVPEDNKISVHRQGPFVFGTAALAIHRIAARISSEDVALPQIKDII